MADYLAGKAAVVTGGSRGIGRAIVLALAGRGADVFFNYASGKDAADEVIRASERTGGRVHAVQADLSAPSTAEHLLKTAERRLGGLDILVNNAASQHSIAPLADIEFEDFSHVMTVNAATAFLTIRYAARHMREGGRIINISSLNTLRPCAGNGPYAASKGAIEQLSAVAAIELGARGITVNVVSPGATDTDLLRSTNSEEDIRAMQDITPLGRLGRPADIADVVAFLAGPEGRWITGQNLRVTGGLG